MPDYLAARDRIVAAGSSKMNIEVIDPLSLPSVSLQERSSLPECAAVYLVLSQDNEVLYIGSAINLAERWEQHHRLSQLLEMSGEIRVAWLECSESTLLLEIQAALIMHFQPYLNYNPQAKGGAPRYKKEGIETARIGVVLPKEIRLRLEQVAENKGWSVSQAAASAIEEWLDLVETPS